MKLYAIPLFILCWCFVGCSPGIQTPTSPNPIDQNPVDLSQGDDSGYHEIATGTMDLEQALKEYWERQNKRF